MFGDSLPDYVLRKEVYVNYPEIESNYFAKIEHKLKDGKSDTIPTVFVRWKEGTKKKEIALQKEKLGAWLAVRFRADTVKVIQY